MTPDIIFNSIPTDEITHKLARLGVDYHVKAFVDDGFDGGAFTAVGMPPNETNLGAWTLISLAENGIKSDISISSCEEDQYTPTNSICAFVYA